MKKALAVGRWEYIEKVKSKAFLISLFLTPMIMTGMFVIPTLLASRPDTESKIVGIIDPSEQVAAPLSRLLEQRFRLPNGQPNYLLREIPVDGSNILAAKRLADSMITTEAMEGCLIIDRDYLNDSVFEYRSTNVGDIRLTEQLSETVREFVRKNRLSAKGLDPKFIQELTKPLTLRTIKITKSGKEEESGFTQIFFTGYIFMMMMFILVLTTGQILVRSMLEEKSNRVVEVLLSSCSANDLMFGKIIGLSALGLTQMLFWVAIGLVVSLKMGTVLLPLPLIILSLLYVVLGYLLYAGIFVAMGAPVSTEQDAQQITTYLMLILFIPIFLAFSIAQTPNSTLIRVLSYIPLLTPSLMIMRISIQLPSPGELIATLIILAVSGIVMMRIAGKIFRTTILFTGKRPNMRELIQFIRMP
jgi:ABC-2 type transport system permease protein